MVFPAVLVMRVITDRFVGYELKTKKENARPGRPCSTRKEGAKKGAERA